MPSDPYGLGLWSEVVGGRGSTDHAQHCLGDGLEAGDELTCPRRVEVHRILAKVPAGDRAVLVKGLRTVAAATEVSGQVRSPGGDQ